MAAQSTTKRQRTDDPDDVQPLRRSELWFDDGNIVIQSESTQFRVHRSVLCAQSSVFKDMFEVCQPSTNDFVVDGCPLVHMHDSAQDLEHVLNAFYGGSRYAEGNTPFAVVAAFIRLGRKYEIEHLRKEAMSLLVCEYPYRLSDWDRKRPITTYFTMPFDAVNLARECGIHSILPAALYRCCSTFTLSSIVKGLKRPDGSDSILSPEDRILCVLAYDKLLHDQASDVLGWVRREEGNPDLVVVECEKASCGTAKRILFEELWYPLPRLRAFGQWKRHWEDDLCTDCVEIAKYCHDEGRMKLWDRLPSYFDLPPWAELRKDG